MIKTRHRVGCIAKSKIYECDYNNYYAYEEKNYCIGMSTEYTNLPQSFSEKL